MDQASQVREKIDIVALISEYIPLKKMGRNFTAICPFHQENSPSFVVSPERQIWHCFGCGKGGDAFTFLMEYENLEFIEALRILAKKTGVTLKNTGTSYQASKKEGIYQLNNLTAEYYNYVLTKHKAGKTALEYLTEKRGLNEKLIKTFNIGYSPASGEDLTKFLIGKKKFSSQALMEAGLSFQKGPRVFDFFRGRIMFPLIDHRGNTVGFSGRNMNEGDYGPKYINTRDTLVYHKGSMFFGLNIAKEEIKKTGSTIVMEGEFDVISAYKEGIGNAVALKGTALTQDQALLLSRFAPKVALCLDSDDAGISAMKRSIPVLEKRGLTITVIKLSGKDPDEEIRSNPVAFKKAIKSDVEVYDYLISKLIQENDISTGIGKKKVADEILPLINLIQNEVVKEHYLKKLSEAIDTSADALEKQLDKKQEKEKEDIAEKTLKTDRREMLEEYLLSLVAQAVNPPEMLTIAQDILIEYKFKLPSVGKIFAKLILAFQKNDKFDLKNVSLVLGQELLPAFDKCFLVPLPKFEDDAKYKDEVIKVAKDLRVIYLKDKIKEIGEKLKNENKEEAIDNLRKQISEITAQLSS
jgi:DNA primase